MYIVSALERDHQKLIADTNERITGEIESLFKHRRTDLARIVGKSILLMLWTLIIYGIRNSVLDQMLVTNQSQL